MRILGQLGEHVHLLPQEVEIARPLPVRATLTQILLESDRPLRYIEIHNALCDRLGPGVNRSTARGVLSELSASPGSPVTRIERGLYEWVPDANTGSCPGRR